MTNREKAEREWEREGWGEPRDDDQARLWTLFFTDGEPDEMWYPRFWHRPARWIQDLVRA